MRLGAAPIKKTSGMGCFVLFAAFILILILAGGFDLSDAHLSEKVLTYGVASIFAAAEILHIPEDVRSSLYWRCPWWIRMLPLPMMLLSIERMWVAEVHIEADGAPDWMSRFKFLVYP